MLSYIVIFHIPDPGIHVEGAGASPRSAAAADSASALASLLRSNIRLIEGNRRLNLFAATTVLTVLLNLLTRFRYTA